ncbi:GAF domain-containing protein [Paracoccus sp. TK19116]|uniref:GAF domain-containing protein n=1 Tax=Paracoccus albicereus TaxID=2922394 RepID=A0ABT1MP18_9RHOB|nr:histidine kinase dimerization/phosphoacceptor domain -containing protein [Paracoccus albicereus]MCQ0969926.1 GAF domain-containing protein [Paracoccus albicereus]
MQADRHQDQHRRLETLGSFAILDTEPEGAYDDIARLAAVICETPVGLVSLVAEDRQWFKAKVGLCVDQTTLDQSICSHAILQQGFLEVPDTQEDPRTRDNPLCIGEDAFRFYAGAQLVAADGMPLGTLCVLDRRPRQLTEMQKDAMQVLARQVMTQLELRRALRNAEILRREVDHRVKNSLQSLSSLTRIERRDSDTPEVIAALDLMANRLDAVSTLHEILHQADAGSNVDLAGYVIRVCDRLTPLMPGNVQAKSSGVAVEVATDQAVAVGMLVNELVANSLKHAFPDERDGRITIDMTRLDDGRVQVDYCDDGIGWGDGPTRRGGLGMRIIELACEELGCELETGDAVDGGATARIAFDPRRRD